MRHPALHCCRLPGCATLARTPHHTAGNDQAAAPAKAEQRNNGTPHFPSSEAAGAVLETALTLRCNSASALSVG